MTRLIYIANVRLPTEKAHGLQITQNCEAFAGAGASVTLWAARRVNTPAMRRIPDIYAHYGPVLAGGRLWVASSDGVIRSFDPESGALLGSTPLPGGAATNPVVAGQPLYVVSSDGRLHAYR